MSTVPLSRWIFTTCIALVTLFSAAQSYAFDGYITITNKTGYDIWFLYVSPESSDGWEEDVLGDSILAAGDQVTVTLEGYKSSVFDIKAVDLDGDSYTFWNVDVAYRDLTITLNDLDEGDSSSGFEGYIDVTNNTGYTIYYLYLSHEDSNSWGEDMLDDSVLMSGNTVTIDVSGYASSVFDVRAVDEDGDSYTVMGLDIAYQDLVLTLAHLD